MTTMTMPPPDVKALVEQIAKWLVDDPAQVIVTEVEEGATVLELEVAPEEVGKLIGKHGRTARALRNLVSSAGLRLNRRYELEILD